MIQIGDYILATGHGYFEKCTVVGVEKKTATLNNGIKFHTKTFEAQNSKKVVELFDGVKYEQLVCKRELPKKLDKISAMLRDSEISMEDIVIIHKKLTKVLGKLNIDQEE